MDAIDWHSSIAVSFDKGYQTTPRFMERLSVWNAAIERWLPIGGAVLDAGCGSGVLSLVAAQRAGSVVAFDGSEEMIRIARGKALPANSGTVTFEVASLSEISNFGAGSFDLVMSSSVLEYVDDLEDALQSHAAMLKKGGTLLVSMPNGESVYRWFEGRIYKVTKYPRYRSCVHHVPRVAAFESRLRNVGLEPVGTLTFAMAPVLGRLMRKAGLGIRSDTMFLTAAQQTKAI